MASPSILTPELRDSLFADIPLTQLARSGGQGEQWQFFVTANEALARGDKDAAVAALHSLVAVPDLEARLYLEGWNALRSLGAQPDSSIAKQLCGVVIEVSLAGGVDTLAGYTDMSARYYNHGGKAIFWEGGVDDRVAPAIAALLKSGLPVMQKCGPWIGEKPPPPEHGAARISMLTPSGLHFGQGPFDSFSMDPIAGRVFSTGARLMEALIELAGSERQRQGQDF
jgi:hypothetical protein